MEDLRVEIDVREDSSLEVTETALLRPPGKGILQRRIVTNRNPEALGLYSELFNLFAHVRVLGVTVDGRPASYTQQDRRFDREVLVDVRGACSPSCTVVLRHRYRGALGYFRTDDELVWRIGGTDWNAPIGSLSARVRLPDGTTGLRVESLTSGYEIPPRSAEHSIEGEAVEANAGHPLQLFEYLHLTLNWDKGFVDEPTLDDLIILFLGSNWPLLIPFALGGVMYGWWRKHGRDPRRRPVPARYEPPRNISPAEAGTLIDNSTDRRDLLATVLDLAAHGHVELRGPVPEKSGSASTGAKVHLVLRTPAAGWDSLLPYERGLLARLFDDGRMASVPVASLDGQASSALPGFAGAVFRRLKERGFYRRRPEYVRAFYQALGVLVALAFIPARASFYYWFGTKDLVTLAAGILSGALLVLWGRYMPRRTRSGTRALEVVLGYEEFLARVESDRLSRLRETPDELASALPYAVAFGVGKQWMDALGGADARGKPPGPGGAPVSGEGAAAGARTAFGLLAPIVALTLGASPAPARRAFRS